MPPTLLATVQQQIQREMVRCHEAVVRIEAVDEHGPLAGTGFFVDPNGLLFTSYTVAGEAHDLVVRRGELKFPARRLVADPRSGVAILQVETQTPFLTLGKSGTLGVGAPVMTFGYPMDLPLTPSFGMISGFDRKYLGRYFATTHLRANVAVQRGEGGAPLLNMEGEVVGILISSLDEGSASFVLPVEAAEKVHRDFVRHGGLRPGWLGLQIEDAPLPVAGSVALIRDLFPNAPAEKAGLHEGDYLLEVAGHKITRPEDMLDASFFLTAGDPIDVRIARGAEEISFQVQPGDPPRQTASPAAAMTTATDLPSDHPLRLSTGP